MSVVVVVLLVVLWAWVLLPGAVREHREASPATSVSRFERTMAQLARANPVRSGSPQLLAANLRALARPLPHADLDPAQRAARRRRHVVAILTAATTLGLFAAQLIDGIAWLLFWIPGVLLAVYLGLLVARWVRLSRAAATPLVHLPVDRPLPMVDAFPIPDDEPRAVNGGFVPQATYGPGDAGVPRGVRVIDW